MLVGLSALRQTCKSASCPDRTAYVGKIGITFRKNFLCSFYCQSIGAAFRNQIKITEFFFQFIQKKPFRLFSVILPADEFEFHSLGYGKGKRWVQRKCFFASDDSNGLETFFFCRGSRSVDVVGKCASKSQQSRNSLLFGFFQVVFQLEEFIARNLFMHLV